MLAAAIFSMKDATIKKLVDLNANFYRSLASPFTASRPAAQPGYQRLLPYFPQQPLEVLDVGCGNGRFGRFLLENRPLEIYTGVDFSKEMIENSSDFPGQIMIRDLSQPGCLAGLGNYGPIVCLATLQHIPGRANRLRLLGEMAGHLAENRTVIISNWQFMSSERQKRKLRPWSTIDLDPEDVESNDYLLSWQRGGSGLRYVAYIDSSEIAELANSAKLRVAEQFYADGREGNLNLYTILAG